LIQEGAFMYKKFASVGGILLALTLGGSALAQNDKSTSADKGSQQSSQKQAKRARITMEQAREIALKRAPGKPESEELEREHGKLVYSFDIRNDKGSITEVQVNAYTGKIERVEAENAKKEAAEKQKEQKPRG
jgi:uncharacterized membrane protein YkoI